MAALTLRLRGERAYSLIEMVIAMALMGIMVPAIGALVTTGAHWGKEEQTDAALQTQVRAAIDTLDSDFRQAYTGDNTMSPVESIASPFTFDSPDRLPTFHLRRIEYRFNGTNLERAVWTSTNTNGPPWTFPNTAAVWIKQLGSVAAGSFTFRDANGAVTATASAVRTVDVSITVKTTTNKARLFTYKTTITMRETQS
jgi:prepilin-type N-terminal cleavage/methylation domain-containing protein